MNITRKEFLGRLVKGAMGLSGAAVLVACSSSSDSNSGDDQPSGSCEQNGTSATIAANHGHVLMVSKADVTAGVAKSYSIKGTADHDHTVMVTAAMFAQLQTDTAITMTSTTDASHSHGVTVMCV